jgi:hypothetical protein
LVSVKPLNISVGEFKKKKMGVVFNALRGEKNGEKNGKTTEKTENVWSVTASRERMTRVLVQAVNLHLPPDIATICVSYLPQCAMLDICATLSTERSFQFRKDVRCQVHHGPMWIRICGSMCHISNDIHTWNIQIGIDGFIGKKITSMCQCLHKTWNMKLPCCCMSAENQTEIQLIEWWLHGGGTVLLVDAFS